MAHDDPYKKLAAKLKSIGAVNYDLRKPLSSGQKSNITKKANQFKDVIERPGTFYKFTGTKKELRNAKEAEYLTSKTHLFVKRKPFYAGASFKKGVLRIKEIQGDGSATLEHTIYLPGTKEFYAYSKKLSEMPRDKNEWLTLKIGANSPFRRSFQSVGEMLNYLSSFKLKDKNNSSWEEIKPEISLVKLHLKRGF